MSTKLDELALDRLFRPARTLNGWTDQPVMEEQLRELYNLLKFGPTSSNCCPARSFSAPRFAMAACGEPT